MTGKRRATVPTAPFLVLRPGKAFWVEGRSLEDCAVTLQAFREGCFDAALCYDQTGGVWRITEARLRRRPTLADRVLPWRQIPVALHVGSREAAETSEIVSRLATVLRSDSEFCDGLDRPAPDLLRLFEQAGTPWEIIRIAELA